MSAKRILIIEDSPSMARTFQAYVEKAGHAALMAETGAAGIETLSVDSPDAVLLDLNLPDMEGMEILRAVSGRQDAPPVIVVTANGSINVAVDAMREGALDFLVKPFGPERLVATLESALERAQLRRTVKAFKTAAPKTGFSGLVGQSLPMQAVYKTIEAAAPSEASVMITGESGTGKELVAQAVHEHSRRAGGPLVVLNCAAIPKDLLESEIFGHIKGAFTGATSDRQGAAERADGGTLFLDELGEMDINLQSKLLRFLQTGTYQKVGETRTRHADIRFVAATNRDPMAAIAEGRLREDLYYRLSVIPVHLPPLRERGEDVIQIARHFLRAFSKEEAKGFGDFTPEACAGLAARAWPGNVRELQNLVRRIVVMHDGQEVTPDMLPGAATAAAPVQSVEARALPARWAEAGAAAASAPQDAADFAVEPLHVVERRAIEKALAYCDGNIQKAARILQINPSTIYRKRAGWSAQAG